MVEVVLVSHQPFVVAVASCSHSTRNSKIKHGVNNYVPIIFITTHANVDHVGMAKDFFGIKEVNIT